MQRKFTNYLSSTKKVWIKKMTDMVNHPAHYTSDPSGIECIDIVRHRNYNIGNAIKYLWRAGLKNEDKHIEDLKKAVFYINDEIKRLEGLKNVSQKGS
jgi:hypothetical protein